MIEPTDSFESWLLRRVAQAVEAGEVPEALLTELQAELEAAQGHHLPKGRFRSGPNKRQGKREINKLRSASRERHESEANRRRSRGVALRGQRGWTGEEFS